MAFDQPLEADRVEDLGLLSFFFRAPVVGSIMWIIGGDMAKRREEEDKLKTQLIGDADDDGCPSPQPGHQQRAATPSPDMNHRYGDNSKNLKKMPPRLLGSDVSNFGECAVDEEAIVLERSSSLGSEQPSNLKRTKKMSWSDESGQDLVEYIEENNKMMDPPQSSSGNPSAKPVKSAMKRSRSVRTEAAELERRNTDTSKLVPKGFGGGPNGLVMPTKPFGDATGNSGYISPEWGWYINTTPPTPEMYHATRHSKKVGKDTTVATQQAGTSQKLPENPTEITPLSNPAFGRSKMAAVGWPSVPL